MKKIIGRFIEQKWNIRYNEASGNNTAADALPERKVTLFSGGSEQLREIKNPEKFAGTDTKITPDSQAEAKKQMNTKTQKRIRRTQ